MASVVLAPQTSASQKDPASLLSTASANPSASSSAVGGNRLVGKVTIDTCAPPLPPTAAITATPNHTINTATPPKTTTTTAAELVDYINEQLKVSDALFAAGRGPENMALMNALYDYTMPPVTTATTVTEKKEQQPPTAAVQPYHHYQPSAQHQLCIAMPTFLWRYGRAHYDASCALTRKRDRDRMVDFNERALFFITQAKALLEAGGPEECEKALAEAIAVAKRTPDAELVENSNVFVAVYKWNAIVLGRKGDYSPTKQKIANAYVIRDLFKKAAEIEPRDSTAQYCMAKWCLSVLQITWLERQIAALLFSSCPPESSVEECLQYANASWAINSDIIRTAVLLGDLYYHQGLKAEAKAWYTKAQQCKSGGVSPEAQIEEARQKASKC